MIFQKWLPALSVSPAGVPIVFCFSRGFPRSVNGSDSSPFKVLLLHWDVEFVRFCLCPLRLESVSYNPPALLYTSPAGLQSQMFWRFVFWCRSPGLGSSVLDWDPWLLEEKLCNCDYPHVCGSPTWECGSWLYCISVPLIVAPSLYM